MIALIGYPTHNNCEEELARHLTEGIDAAAYPVRCTRDTERHSQNCWNPEADDAERIGLPVVKTICSTCEFRGDCHKLGYLAQTTAARQALVSFATHQRIAKSGFNELVDDRSYIVLHENALGVLRPEVSIQLQDLHIARRFVETLVRDPFFLNFYSEATQIDADGESVPDEDANVRRQRHYQTALALAGMLEHLEEAIEQAITTCAWVPKETMLSPPGFEGFLWWALKYSKVYFEESPWQFILAAFNGQLHAAMIIVSQRHVKGLPQGTTRTSKKVFGVIKNDPPAGRNVWLCDATAEPDVLATLIDAPVEDATPDGTVPLFHKALQYHRDVTRKTRPSMFLALVRGLLCQYHDRPRIGLITHSNLLDALENLEPEFRERIVKTSYYGSGDERSSNDWYGQCDLILVLGTPRVPTETVVEYLIRIGELEAACSPSVWGDVFWHAVMTSGAPKKLSGRGYHDPLWMKAHRAIVRANIVQAIGRGRGILKDGCDVIVLSSEECGLRVIDAQAPLLGDHLWSLYGQFCELTARKPLNSIYKKLAVSTSEVAQATNLPERTTRHMLADLEALQLIHRESPRSGWYLGPKASEGSAVNESHPESQSPDPNS